MKSMAYAVREALKNENKKTVSPKPTPSMPSLIRESLYRGTPCHNKQAMIVGIEEELKAIKIYEELLLNATNEGVKTLLSHVIEEEKHHVEEFQALLAQLNGDFS